jgi:hypothetical protein
MLSISIIHLAKVIQYCEKIIFSYLGRLPKWDFMVLKTRGRNSHVWAPLKLSLLKPSYTICFPFPLSDVCPLSSLIYVCPPPPPPTYPSVLPLVVVGGAVAIYWWGVVGWQAKICRNNTKTTTIVQH